VPTTCAPTAEASRVERVVLRRQLFQQCNEPRTLETDVALKDLTLEGSEPSISALQRGKRIEKGSGTDVVMLHVGEVLENCDEGFAVGDVGDQQRGSPEPKAPLFLLLDLAPAAWSTRFKHATEVGPELRGIVHLYQAVTTSGVGC